MGQLVLVVVSLLGLCDTS